MGEYSARAPLASSGSALGVSAAEHGHDHSWRPIAAGAGGSRRFTSIVATTVVKGEPRTRLLGATSLARRRNLRARRRRARGALSAQSARSATKRRAPPISRCDSRNRARQRGHRHRPRQGGSRGEPAAKWSTARHRWRATRRRAKSLLDTTTAELARGRFALRTRSDGSSVLGGALALAPRSRGRRAVRGPRARAGSRFSTRTISAACRKMCPQ